MRYWTQQRQATYATGSQYLIRNDQPLPPPAAPEVLTDRQTEEAIRIIKEQINLRRPFFLNIWFDAPHSPWEAIAPYFAEYSGKFDTERLQKYASMISNMDMNIGRLMDALDQLGVFDSTLVMFTSDNGPENEAGSTGKFKGQKRLLTEGGIRVPAIVVWPGRVPADTMSDKYAVGTDVYPTLIDAAGIMMPSHIRIDGMSILPLLTQPSAVTAVGDERIVLYFSHSIGFPKLASAQAYGYKLLWNDYEGRKGTKLPPALRLFDMRVDPYEDSNLLPSLLEECASLESDRSDASGSMSFADIRKLPRGQTSSLMRDKGAMRVLLQLASHLHLLQHVFKYLGDRDWIEYHENKVHANEASCAGRSVNNSTSMIFTNPIILPAFCGCELFMELSALDASPRSCSCSFDSVSVSPSVSVCDERWTKSRANGWMNGPILPHLLNFGRSSDGFVQYIDQLLEASKYKSLCTFHRSDPFKSGSHKTSLDTSLTTHPTHCEYTLSSSDKWVLENGGWASSSVLSMKNNNEVTWIPVCHQRLHVRSYSTTESLHSASVSTGYNTSAAWFHLTTNNCGADAAVTVVNHPGMPFPIHVCPSSLRKLSPSDITHTSLNGASAHPPKLKLSLSSNLPYFDDDMMMATLYELLLSPQRLSEHIANSPYVESSDRSFPIMASLSSTRHPPLSSVVLADYARSVGIIDALFYRFSKLELLGLSTDNLLKSQKPKDASWTKDRNTQSKGTASLTNQFLQLSFSRIKEVAADDIPRMFPFYDHLVHRIQGSSIYRLKQLVIPVLDNERWSVVVLYGDISASLSVTSSTNVAKLTYIYYDPTGSVHDILSERRKELVGSLVENLFMHLCLRRCKPADLWIQHYLVDTSEGTSNSAGDVRQDRMRTAALSGAKIISFMSSFAVEAMRCFLQSNQTKSDSNCFAVSNLQYKFPKQGKLLKKVRQITESFIQDGQKRHHQLTKYLNYMATDKY